jgi:hypothetical protein
MIKKTKLRNQSAGGFSDMGLNQTSLSGQTSSGSASRSQRGRANDPSSATRPKRALECNVDVMAGFAAAHG